MFSIASNLLNQYRFQERCHFQVQNTISCKARNNFVTLIEIV